jgi:hypothetical protein
MHEAYPLTFSSWKIHQAHSRFRTPFQIPQNQVIQAFDASPVVLFQTHTEVIEFRISQSFWDSAAEDGSLRTVYFETTTWF